MTATAPALRRKTLTLSSRVKPAPEPASKPRKLEPPRWPPEARDVFFFIWSPLWHRPSKRHLSIEIARAEQARLNSLNPEGQFLLYEARVVQPHHYTDQNKGGPEES